jgi:integrase
MKRLKTKYTGVYERKSDAKEYNGKSDICFDIVYRDQGKLIWEKIGWVSEGYTARLAEQVRSERIRGIRHGEELPKQKAKAPYFEAVTKKYIEWAKQNKKSWYDDQSRIGLYLTPAYEGKRLTEISAFDIERLKSQLSKQGLADATVKHAMVLMRQIYNKALAWGLYKGENPIKGVKMPSIQNARERFLSYDEAKTLLEALKLKSNTLHDMATISLQCGLRAGEIFNLKGQHIDFLNGFISISDPKNKQARKAYMTNAVKEILEKRISEKDDYIFPDKRHGEKIKAVSKAFRGVVNNLGLNNGIEDARQQVTFHTLRHTFASWLALQGESLVTIRELLGHKSFEMTKRYAHLIPDEKRKATLRLEQAFDKKAVKTEEG